MGLLSITAGMITMGYNRESFNSLSKKEYFYSGISILIGSILVFLSFLA